MKPHRYTVAQVVEALLQTKGLVTLAAKRLGCSADTVQNYCKKFPTVQAAKASARTELLDLAELKLWLAVQNSESWAIAFTRRTIGRDRGYSEQVHVDLRLTIERAASRVAAHDAGAAAPVGDPGATEGPRLSDPGWGPCMK
jgi:hypothetical protein